MSNTVPFDPPHFLTSRQTEGCVVVSTDSNGYDLASLGVANDLDRGWDYADMATGTSTATASMPNFVGKQETIRGTIVEIETENIDGDLSGPTTIAFLLQRTLYQQSLSRDVVVKLGYRLRSIQNEEQTHAHNKKLKRDERECCRWEIDVDESGQRKLVRIHTRRNSGEILQQSTGRCHQSLNSPFNELSALQMVAKIRAGEAVAHVDGSNLIASSGENGIIYTVLPYYRDGTLLELCQSIGRLTEPLARFVFRQILKGLETLNATGLCHRDISFDTIALDGDRVVITGLGWALRCRNLHVHSSSSDHRSTDNHHQCYPPTPGGSNPHFIPPEWYHNKIYVGNDNDDGHRCTWNGFRDDLWGAGLLLYSMVVGIDALFTAPIAGDNVFTRICIKGDIRGSVEGYGRRLGKDYHNLLSEDLEHLLQSMLRADPKQRLSLKEVIDHPWVTKKDSITTITEWTESH